MLKGISMNYSVLNTLNKENFEWIHLSSLRLCIDTDIKFDVLSWTLAIKTHQWLLLLAFTTG